MFFLSWRFCLLLALFGSVISTLKIFKLTLFSTSSEDEGLHPLEAIGFNKTRASSFWQSCSLQQLSGKWKPIRDLCIAINLVYIKVPKTASSTAGGVMRRIASRYGVWGAELDIREAKQADFEPILKANHWEAHYLMSRNRLQLRNTSTFLMTFLRDPVERAFSEYYHVFVSRHNFSTSASAVTKFLQALSGSYMSDYIDLEHNSGGRNLLRFWYRRDAELILKDYSFVGIAERMPESLVILKHILQLPSLCDILFFSVKISAGLGKDDRNYTFVRHMPLAEQPQKVRKLVASRRFKKKMATDEQLYKKANELLDKWISYFGLEVIRVELSSFTNLLSKVKARCSNTVVDCYWNDNGCQYPCMDQICKDAEAY